MNRLLTYLCVFSFALFLTANIAQAQPGTLDPTFGNGGIATIDCPGSPQSGALQSDGKILILTGSPYASRLVRFNPDGSLDDGSVNDTTPGDAFGIGGLVAINWPGVNGSGWPYDLAVQTVNGSERIVIVGYAAVQSRNKFVEGTRVDRLLLDGSLDTSFGTQGTTSFAGTAAMSVAVQSDQKVVLGGGTTLYRLNANGSTDTSFGSGGKVSTVIGVSAVETQSDGKIVLVGSTSIKNKTFAAVSRHNSNGSVDQTFGSSGKATADFAGNQARDISIAPNGYIYASGTSGSSTLAQNAVVARFIPSGQLDAGFGFGGIASYDSGIGDVGWRIGLQPDGKVLVAGNVISSVSANADILTTRFDSAGNIDYSFGSNGGAIIDLFGGGETSRGVFVQNLGSETVPDHRVIVTGAGSANGTPYVFAVRYNY